MSEQHLATYLNDHLAGAVAALELLEHLGKAHADTPTGRFAAELRADIAADRKELEALMARLQAPISARSPGRTGRSRSPTRATRCIST